MSLTHVHEPAGSGNNRLAAPAHRVFGPADRLAGPADRLANPADRLARLAAPQRLYQGQ